MIDLYIRSQSITFHFSAPSNGSKSHGYLFKHLQLDQLPWSPRVTTSSASHGWSGGVALSLMSDVLDAAGSDLMRKARLLTSPSLPIFATWLFGVTTEKSLINELVQA